ncbi:YraN family protein [bacterium]|nr:YraN family protein [bacterium]
MGHVPAGPIPQASSGDDLPRRQRRGARSARSAAARGIGTLGEDLAAALLERRGGSIVARNVRIGHDEIDLVADIDGRRVVVEVKTRIGAAAADEFSPEQARRLRRAATSLRPRVDRCDLIAVRIGATGATLSWRRAVA